MAIVKLKIDEIVQLAFKQALREGILSANIPDTHRYEHIYTWRDPIKREGLFVEFEAKEQESEPETPYEAGSWKDPEIS